MEGKKDSSTKRAKGSGIDIKVLKAMFSGVDRPDVLLKARREYGTEKALFELMPRSGWSKAISESEVARGLTLVDELSEVRGQVNGLISEVESVRSELRACKEGIEAILSGLDGLREKPVTKQVELLDIDESLEVISPIPIVIEEYNDEVIAAFPEIEAFGAGLCEAEAIVNLKEKIREIFFELEEANDDELGKLPLSWKRVLLKVVKKIGQPE